MTSSNRDNLIKLLLPALAIALCYTAWPGVRKHKELTARQAEVATKQVELDQVKQNAPLVIGQLRQQIREHELKLTQLSGKIEDLQRGQKAARERWTVLAGNCASGEQRIQRIASLTTLMKAHNLTLIADAKSDAGNAAKLPPALEKLGQLLTQKTPTLSPELRQLHFRGNFVGVHDLLVELSRGEMVAIPLGVTMKPSKQGNDVREWTLVVWI